MGSFGENQGQYLISKGNRSAIPGFFRMASRLARHRITYGFRNQPSD
jgi:hypothetical protein